MSGSRITRAVGRRRLLALGLLGAIQAILLASLTLLFVNYPAGYDSPYGLNLLAAGYFRLVWAYPVLEVSATAFLRRAWLIIIGLWIVYLASLPLVRRLEIDRWRRPAFWILSSFFLLSTLIVVVFMPPMFSADVYHYALYGRMAAFHDLNPYVVTGSAVPGDLFWPLTAWREVTSRYGPAWTLISAGLTTLAGDSILATLVLFKVFAALCFVVNGALVFFLARLLTGGLGLVALLLFAWNPLILIESVGNAHADAAMLVLALLGLWLGLRGRPLWGLLCLLLSMQVKLTTALLVPFYVVYFWRDWARVGRGWYFILQAMGVALVSSILLYLPFATPGASVGKVLLAGQADLNVMPNPLWLSLRRGLVSVADSLGWGTVETAPDITLVILLTIGFGVLMLVLLVDLARNGYGWPRIVWLWGVLTLGYILVVHGGSFPWYLILPMTAAAIAWPAARTHRFWALCIGLGIATMLGYGILLARPLAG